MDPQVAVRVARRALQDAADEGDRHPGALDGRGALPATLPDADQHAVREWSQTQAEAIVTAVLLDVA